MRITLVIPSLERGGAERVMSILANAWATQGKKITLLTLNRATTIAYALHPTVKLWQLDLPSNPTGAFYSKLFWQIRRVRTLRQAIRESQPEVVISFLERTNVLTLLSTRGLGIPVIVSERADPRMHDIGRLWRLLRRMTYGWSELLVCQTETSLEWFSKRMSVVGCVIPNPVMPPIENGQARPEVDKNSGGHVIVGIGRLVPEKGFDLLLQAFANVADSHPNWSLIILGEGPLRHELVTQVQKLHLEKRVEFRGAVQDPFTILRSADLFVLSSRFEGFPNALCEAMACGVASISFNCLAGPADIIRHGTDGFLVPAGNVAALATAIARLMNDENERALLASRAPEILTRFSADRISLMWEHAIGRVLSVTS